MRELQRRFRNGRRRGVERATNLLAWTGLAFAFLLFYPLSPSSGPLVFCEPGVLVANLRPPSRNGPARNGGQRSGPFFSGTVNRQINATRMKQASAAREKALREDAENLLKLAAELNSELTAPSAGPIERNELRKVTKIEKLARRVERNMSAK